ncbi:MotA/TolQ/ExbB proton channel family protein [Glaesserella parasuis]|uniref:MotA/TolQ/ExbB proton channel family protein n=1 Tax=Glaesserella parasuis TaxID=738 RepID=UPI0013651C4A|nr:MotA/TolQ/ExbB proton channel family protein [Glaesserella parasuis]
MMFATPTILTSLGILGTFVGISVALYDFNVQDLDASIPILLDGMKIAFFTSVIGMALSILLKIIMLYLGKENERKENKFFEEQIKIQTESLKNTLPTLFNQTIEQLEKSNKGNKLFEKKLFNQLDNFTSDLTEQTTNHILEALESIVVNFNDSLAQQFGENFARLDESVKNMLKWQDNYKSLLEGLSQKHELNARTLVEVKDSILMIEGSISNIPVLVQDFEKLIRFNQNQIGRIGEEMMIFSDIKDKTLELFPVIQKQFSQLYLNIEDTAKRLDLHLLERINNIENNSKNIIFRNQQINDDILNITTKIKESLDDINQSLVSRLSNIQIDFDKSVEKMQDSFGKSVEKMQEGFDKTVEQTSNKQVTQFESITETLSKENKNFVNELITQINGDKGLFKGIFGGKK